MDIQEAIKSYQGAAEDLQHAQGNLTIARQELVQAMVEHGLVDQLTIKDSFLRAKRNRS